MNVLNHFMLCGVLLSVSLCQQGTDNRPILSDTFKETWDLEFNRVSLSYDYSSLPVPQYSEDINQLSSNHFMSNPTGAIEFFHLLSGFSQDLGTKGPEAKFIFYSPNYRGEIEKSYHTQDDYLCSHNIIHNAPYINTKHYIEFSARTMSTRNGVQLKWNKVIELNGYGVPSIVVEQGSLDYPTKSLVAYTTTGDLIAVRLVRDYDGIYSYEVVGNTGPDVPPGDYEVEDPVQVGTPENLDGSVCVGGDVDPNLGWDAPLQGTLK